MRRHRTAHRALGQHQVGVTPARDKPFDRVAPHRQLSRLTELRPVAAAWKAGSM